MQSGNIERISSLIPFVYILLTSKTNEIYQSAFKFLYQKILEYGYDMKNKPFETRIVQADYEISLRSNLKNELYYDEVMGCFSHFAGNLYKNAVKKGLRYLILNNIVFQLKYIFLLIVI